jgi:threonine 3-dehydrogenase
VEVVADWPEPECGQGEVRVEVAAASVCGTDRELFEFTSSAQAFEMELPVVLGHECAGTVIETGAGVQRVRVGDRVACESHVPCGHCFCCRTGSEHNCANLRILGMHLDGAFAERAVVPEGICFELPAELDLSSAALLEPAGVAMHAVQRAAIGVPGVSALVSGCGPVGLAVIQLITAMGAARVTAVEPNPFRRGLAAKLGATVLRPDEDIVAACRNAAGIRGGCDVAFEASGAPGALGPLLAAVRREATVVTIGHPGQEAAIDVARFINKKGVTLRGVFGRRIWDTWEALAALVSAGKVDLGALITHRLDLAEFEQAIALLSRESGKVLLLPGLRSAPESSS